MTPFTTNENHHFSRIKINGMARRIVAGAELDVRTITYIRNYLAGFFHYDLTEIYSCSGTLRYET